MSPDNRQLELREKTQQLLHGSLKHVRVAALAAALVPLASVAVSPAVVSAQGSGGTGCVLTGSGDPFALNSAGAYTVLGMRLADVNFGSSATLITGNVGVGPYDTGSLLKARINGTLFLDPTATPSIHSDLVATGGTVSMDLTPAVFDAEAANVINAGKPPTQAGISVGDVPISTIALANPTGPNVVPVTSVNTHGIIAVVGDASASVVFNVTGGFTCNGCSIVFTANSPGGSPIVPQHVLWNFIGAGDDVSISKPVGSAQGIFLAPGRNLLLDKASVTGALMGAEGGRKLLVHSGAKLTCP